MDGGPRWRAAAAMGLLSLLRFELGEEEREMKENQERREMIKL